MAERNDKQPRNVPGAFYVDSSCVDCDLCRTEAAQCFDRDDETGASYVYRQPVTAEEIARAQGVLEGCPSESIGNDG